MKKTVLILLALMAYIQPGLAQEAGTIEIQIDPDQCVAMEQGQKCFVDIVVNWQATQAENICLYLGDEKRQCWTDAKSGKVQQEIAIVSPVKISLKRLGKMVASETLEYAWVYRKTTRKAARWRLF